MSSPSSTKPDPSDAAPLAGDGGTAVSAGKVKLPPVVWLLGAVEVVRTAGAGRSLPMALAPSAFQVGIAAGSWLGGIALTSSLGLRGPSPAGFAFALAALLPLGLLAASHHKTCSARS